MKGTQISLDYLKTFRNLVETKSFSKTAAKNFLTQSAISQQLHFLERALGKKLIERGNGKFDLTEAGVALLDGASSIGEIYQKTLDRIHSMSGEVRGSVKIESAYSIALYLLPSFIRGFMKKYPNVQLEVEHNKSTLICKSVLSGTCDIGVVVFPCCNHPLIQLVPFKKELLVFACSLKHPLSQRKSLRLNEIGNHPFVTFHKDLRTRQVIDVLFRERHIKLNIAQEFDNIETLKRSIEVGTGASILPQNTILQEIKNKTLRSIRIEGGPYYRESGIVVRKGENQSTAVREFVKWLRK